MADMQLSSGPPYRRGDFWEQVHCGPRVLEEFDGCEWHTTLRDPWRVAVSWANRGRIDIKEPGGEMKWFQQWRYWAEIAKSAEIHPIAELENHLGAENDRLGLYKALETQDFNYYHGYIPFDFIEFALQCVQPYSAESEAPTRG